MKARPTESPPRSVRKLLQSMLNVVAMASTLFFIVTLLREVKLAEVTSILITPIGFLLGTIGALVTVIFASRS